MNCAHGQRSRGFTLIELMITLVVAAILIAMATPSFVDFFERYRLRSAVDDAVTIFAHARQAAVEADRNVTVSVDVDHWCVGAIQVSDPSTAGELVQTSVAPCECKTANACLVDGAELVADGSRAPGVTVAATNPTFTFDSKNGTLTDLSLSPEYRFESSSARYGLTLQVRPLGQARVCVTDGKRPIAGYQSCS